MAKSFTEIIQRNFPADEKMGFFVKPNIPANQLGRVLNEFTRISPADVVACAVFGSMFDKEIMALTATHLYYEGGSFLIEDIRGCTTRENLVDVEVNVGGNTSRHVLKTVNADAAKVLGRALDTLGLQPKADDLMPEKPDYSKFSASSLSWLELRDEVMRTIDLLYERFQSGKINLLEFEEKKADLLGRL